MSPELRNQPRKRFPPDDPREWLNRARSNLAQAEQGIEIPDVYLEDLCFNAQQAAEKALKAVLIEHELEFPYVHDLVKLMETLLQGGHDVPNKVREAPVSASTRSLRVILEALSPSHDKTTKKRLSLPQPWFAGQRMSLAATVQKRAECTALTPSPSSSRRITKQS